MRLEFIVDYLLRDARMHSLTHHCTIRGLNQPGGVTYQRKRKHSLEDVGGACTSVSQPKETTFNALQQKADSQRYTLTVKAGAGTRREAN